MGKVRRCASESRMAAQAGSEGKPMEGTDVRHATEWMERSKCQAGRIFEADQHMNCGFRCKRKCIRQTANTNIARYFRFRVAICCSRRNFTSIGLSNLYRA